MEKEITGEKVENHNLEEQGRANPEQKSKYSDYVHSDGRKWDDLTAEERKKVRKKLNKKNKKQSKKQNIQELTKKHQERTKGKSNFEKELLWCIDQIKLGLTHNAVTPEQCKPILKNQ